MHHNNAVFSSVSKFNIIHYDIKYAHFTFEKTVNEKGKYQIKSNFSVISPAAKLNIVSRGSKIDSDSLK